MRAAAFMSSPSLHFVCVCVCVCVCLQGVGVHVWVLLRRVLESLKIVQAPFAMLLNLQGIGKS